MIGEHEQVASGVPSLAMQVDRDNVLQARALLLQEADQLDAVLVKLRSQLIISVERCGNDPVSADAAIAFPERTKAMLTACQAHNDDLRRSADTLVDVARTYGYTEDDILAALPGIASQVAANALPRPW